MDRMTQFMIGMLLVVIVLVCLAANRATGGESQALTIAFSATFGLLSIALTQHLDARSALLTSTRERLQEARGMARALASEIDIVSTVWCVKWNMLLAEVGDHEPNPDTLLGYIQLPSRAVFDANVHKISLLEVIEEFGAFSENEERLVERVVGFYEGLADFRSAVAEAKLKSRDVNTQELSGVQSQMKATTEFADELVEKLREFIALSYGSPAQQTAARGRVRKPGA